MRESRQGISLSRSIVTLALLLVVDVLGFLSIGHGPSGLEFGLLSNTASWVGLGVDLALAVGLVRAADWALELARYRCVIGLSYLAFIWSSYFIVMRTSVGAVGQKTLFAGLIRDGWLGALLLIALFVIREKKKPLIPGQNGGADEPVDKQS